MGDQLTTFVAARGENPYALARKWGEQQPSRGLEELAVMSALAHWLTSWMPITMHQALTAGATVDQVAAAAGVAVDQVAERWRTWADGQVALREQTNGTLGLAAADRDRVAAILAAGVGH
ncbi:hypothetical protein [Micromonospora fluostatini]|uniref:hypothetical protein n=1 Tax=Micromonospora sp. JCM 30529 TaxID=3421643 RepID=UPI003D1753E7